MKQIILISRIHSYGNIEEFDKYSNDINLPELPKISSKDYHLIIINGGLLRNAGDEYEMAEEVVKMAIKQGFNNASETLVAYHYNSQVMERAMESVFDEENWAKIIPKKYSSAADADKSLYAILNPLGEAIKQDKKADIEALIQELGDAYLSSPSLLDAKLDFLHSIYNGEMVSQVPDILKNSDVISKFEPLKDEKYINENDKMREELKQLRDAVLRVK